jgi:hypothetical protein
MSGQDDPGTELSSSLIIPEPYIRELMPRAAVFTAPLAWLPTGLPRTD